MSHGDDGVGDGGTDVGTHDHEHGGLDGELISSDEGDHDGRSGGRGLDEHGGEDTDHQRGDRVVRNIEHLGRVLASEELEAGAHDTEGKEEHPEAVEDEEREDGLLDGVLIGGSEPLGLRGLVGLLLSGHLVRERDLGEGDALLGSLGLGVGGVLHVLDGVTQASVLPDKLLCVLLALDEVTLVDLEAVVLPDELLCGSETEKYERRSAGGATRDAMAG